MALILLLNFVVEEGKKHGIIPSVGGVSTVWLY